MARKIAKSRSKRGDQSSVTTSGDDKAGIFPLLLPAVKEESRETSGECLLRAESLEGSDEGQEALEEGEVVRDTSMSNYGGPWAEVSRGHEHKCVCVSLGRSSETWKDRAAAESSFCGHPHRTAVLERGWRHKAALSHWRASLKTPYDDHLFLRKELFLGNGPSREERNLASELFREENIGEKLFRKDNLAPGLYKERNLASGLYKERNLTSELCREENIGEKLFRKDNLAPGLYKERNLALGLLGEDNIVSGPYEKDNSAPGNSQKDDLAPWHYQKEDYVISGPREAALSQEDSPGLDDKTLTGLSLEEDRHYYQSFITLQKINFNDQNPSENKQTALHINENLSNMFGDNTDSEGSDHSSPEDDTNSSSSSNIPLL